MAAVTAIIAYPNKYTRMNASELIYLLFTQCGVTNEMDICDYVNRNFTNANHAVPIAEAGPGVYTALWQLTLALMFKFVITIFTFGIKVRHSVYRPNLYLPAAGSCWLVHSLVSDGCNCREDCGHWNGAACLCLPRLPALVL